jgi:hypothetical protein
MEEAKEGLRYAIDLDKDIRALALDDEDLKPPWTGSAVCNSRQGLTAAAMWYSSIFPASESVSVL